MDKCLKFKKSIALACLAAFAVLGLVLATSLNREATVADAATGDTFTVSVAVGGETADATGNSYGVSAWVDNATVGLDEEVILHWRGKTVGTDFVIPTSVSINESEQVYSIGSWFEVDKMQEENLAYNEKMGGTATMTSFDRVNQYLASAHSFSLGALNADATINVTFTLVSPVYRMYNMITSEHLFSTNKTEYDNFVVQLREGKDFWIGEGIDWFAPSINSTTNTNTVKVKRLYNAGLGAMARSNHYYTSDAAEVQNLVANHGWVEDPEVNWFTSSGSTAVYTAYSEALLSAHHYTASWEEWRGLDGGWDKEDAKNGLNANSNGAEGVFKCITGSNWSFSGNYYKVNHVVGGVIKDTEYISGVAGQQTQATVGVYNGYTAPETVAQQTIANDNSTVVTIEYTAEPDVYNGHKYKKISKTDITWDEAQAACEAMGGYLVCITSEEERSYIFNQFGSCSYYWTGGYRPDGSENKYDPVLDWKWVSGEPFEYTNWLPGQPQDEWGDNTETKIIMWGSEGKWGDIRNNAPSGQVYGYVCEWDL